MAGKGVVQNLGIFYKLTMLPGCIPDYDERKGVIFSQLDAMACICVSDLEKAPCFAWPTVETMRKQVGHYFC